MVSAVGLPSLSDVLAADTVCLSIAAGLGLQSLANLGHSCPLFASHAELQPLKSTAPVYWDPLPIGGSHGSISGALRIMCDKHDQVRLHEQILAAARQCPNSVTIADLGRFRECIDTLGTGVQPLHIAAQQGLDRTCWLLLSLQADLHATDAKGQTPLIKAVLNGHDRAALLLISAGAGMSINATDSLQRSALHFACMFCSAEVVDALISEKAMVEARDGRRWTPLMYAVAAAKKNTTRQAGHDAIDRLLAARADPTATDRLGRSVIQIARTTASDRVAALLEASEASHTST